MKQQIFDTSISPKCRNCQFGDAAAGGKIILCTKSGVRAPDDACKKYRYDPLKRDPEPVKTIVGADLPLFPFRLIVRSAVH